MSAIGPRAPLELEQDMVAALDLLGRARRALARGELPELDQPMALLESLRAALGRTATHDRRRQRALLALLDEAGVGRRKAARGARPRGRPGCARRPCIVVPAAAYRRASRL